MTPEEIKQLLRIIINDLHDKYPQNKYPKTTLHQIDNGGYQQLIQINLKPNNHGPQADLTQRYNIQITQDSTIKLTQGGWFSNNNLHQGPIHDPHTLNQILHTLHKLITQCTTPTPHSPKPSNKPSQTKHTPTSKKNTGS